METRPPKPVIWVGSSHKDLLAFPRAVQRDVGRALLYAQLGGKHPDAAPLKGFGGAGVLEIVERTESATYRAVYTVRLAGRVYVLHAFQKKSTKGIATPKHELELIRARLKAAQELHRQLEDEGGMQ